MVRQKNPVAPSQNILARATSIYHGNCLECHGPEGRGDGPTSGMLARRPADLTDPAVLGTVTDGQIFWTVTKGDKPAMPGFEGKLNEEERWGLVHLMRKLSNTQPNSSPCPPR